MPVESCQASNSGHSGRVSCIQARQASPLSLPERGISGAGRSVLPLLQDAAVSSSAAAGSINNLDLLII